MSFLQHKEKERLRHHKQLHLLNKVYEHIPQFSDEPQTKVRKLRRLILYVHYLKLIEKKFKNKSHNELSILVEKPKDLCPSMGTLKVSSEPRKKSSKAHIVYLNSAKSKACSKKRNFQKFLETDLESESCCIQESVTVPVPAIYEYTIPDVILPRAFSVDAANSIQHIHSNSNVFTSPIKSSPIGLLKYGIMNDTDLEHKLTEIGLTSVQHSLAERENFITNSIKHECTENTYIDDEVFVKNVIVNENLSSSQPTSDNSSITKDPDDSYILKDITFSTVINDSHDNPDSSQNEKYIPYHFAAYPVTSASNVSKNTLFVDSSNFLHENSVLSVNPVYYPSCLTHFASGETHFPKPHSASYENISENSISSTLTANSITDVEDVSDSKLLHNQFSDDSNHSKNAFNHLVLTSDESAQSSETTNFSPNASLLPSFNTFRNSYFINADVPLVSITDMPQSLIDDMYPTKRKLSEVYAKANSVQPKPSDNAADYKSAFSDTEDLLYPPVNHNFQIDDFPSHLKFISGENISSEVIIDTKLDSCFEEEVSYPLAQFFAKCHEENI